MTRTPTTRNASSNRERCRLSELSNRCFISVSMGRVSPRAVLKSFQLAARPTTISFYISSALPFQIFLHAHLRYGILSPAMIARVTLEMALRKEFDYSIPPALSEQVEVGSRVQVPFGPRKVLGCVTGLAEESAHASLKPILKVIGAQTLVTPKVLKLARWIAEYYCCAPEIALKSVLPDAVRQEQAGWREMLFVHALPINGELPKLSKRQKEIWHIIEERRELPLKKLLEIADTAASTIRRLEDKGLVAISAQISERDPYAREHFLPTQPLPLNPPQAKALDTVVAAMDQSQKSVAKEQRKSESPITSHRSPITLS